MKKAQFYKKSHSKPGKNFLSRNFSTHIKLISQIDFDALTHRSNALIIAVFKRFKANSDADLSGRGGRLLILTYCLLVLVSDSRFLKNLFDNQTTIFTPPFFTQHLNSVMKVKTTGVIGTILINESSLINLYSFFDKLDLNTLKRLVQNTPLAYNSFVKEENLEKLKHSFRRLIIPSSKDGIRLGEIFINYSYLGDLLEMYGDLFSGMELMPFEIKQPSTSQQAIFGFRNISPSGLIYAIDIDLLKQLEEEESLFLSCVLLLYTINGLFSVHLTEETKRKQKNLFKANKDKRGTISGLAIFAP